VTSDDPRWIECERSVLARMTGEDDAAQMLITVLPITMEGAVALLRYAVAPGGLAYCLPPEGYPKPAVMIGLTCPPRG
jgi:hypothetical protein